MRFSTLIFSSLSVVALLGLVACESMPRLRYEIEISNAKKAVKTPEDLKKAEAVLARAQNEADKGGSYALQKQLAYLQFILDEGKENLSKAESANETVAHWMSRA
jgi:hypothetical protein